MTLYDFLDQEDYNKQRELHLSIQVNPETAVSSGLLEHPEDLNRILQRAYNPEVGKAKDSRTGFVSTETYYDYLSYFNYIHTINKYHNMWENYGYLDSGLIPIIYPPSINHTLVTDYYRPKCVKAGLHLIELKSSSFFKPIYNGSNDYWITRKEAGEFLGVNPLDAKVEDVLRKVVSICDEINRV